MEYQERIKLILDRVNGFLRQYQRPTHLDTEAALKEIRAIAEEVNSLISASSNRDALEERAEACFRAVRRNYTQRAWPTVAHFVKAMGEIQSPRSGDTGGLKTPEQIAADRISKGEPVGDSWIYGRLAVKILREGMVTVEQIKGYRLGLFYAAKEVYGEEKARRMEEQWKASHNAAAGVWGQGQ